MWGRHPLVNMSDSRPPFEDLLQLAIEKCSVEQGAASVAVAINLLLAACSLGEQYSGGFGFEKKEIWLSEKELSDIVTRLQIPISITAQDAEKFGFQCLLYDVNGMRGMSPKDLLHVWVTTDWLFGWFDLVVAEIQEESMRHIVSQFVSKLVFSDRYQEFLTQKGWRQRWTYVRDSLVLIVRGTYPDDFVKRHITEKFVTGLMGSSSTSDYCHGWREKTFDMLFKASAALYTASAAGGAAADAPEDRRDASSDDDEEALALSTASPAAFIASAAPAAAGGAAADADASSGDDEEELAAALALSTASTASAAPAAAGGATASTASTAPALDAYYYPDQISKGKWQGPFKKQKLEEWFKHKYFEYTDLLRHGLEGATLTFGELFDDTRRFAASAASAASTAVTEEMVCEYKLSLLALEDIKAQTNDDLGDLGDLEAEMANREATALGLVEWLMGNVISMRLREILPVSSLRNAMRSGATSVVEILTIMSESGVSRDCYDELERCLEGWQDRLLAL